MARHETFEAGDVVRVTKLQPGSPSDVDYCAKRGAADGAYGVVVSSFDSDGLYRVMFNPVGEPCLMYDYEMEGV